MAESFFSTLKSVCFYLMKYNSINELKQGIDEYIHYYNHERISLSLKGLSPVEYRTQALLATWYKLSNLMGSVQSAGCLALDLFVE